MQQNEYQAVIDIIAIKRRELRKAASAARREHLRKTRELAIVRRAGRILQNPTRVMHLHADLKTLAQASRIVKKTLEQ